MKSFISRFILCLSFLPLFDAESQTIGTFSSIEPTAQTQSFVLPATHTFQRIIRSGDALTDASTLGGNLDFTGYVPISSSSRAGYLSISSETFPAKVAIMNVNYNYVTHLWDKSNSVNVPLSIGAGSDLGNVAAFCSGTVTPNGTIMVAEETTVGGNANSTVDGYEDLGWVIEINPATKQVMDYNNDGVKDKLWAVGRQTHENVIIRSDNTIMYWGADHSTNGFMYKFVPTVPGDFTSGTLSVLITTPGLGTGTWVTIANNTVTERNNTVSASTSAGAYNFNGIEDAEIGPDGLIYFAAKAAGRVYRFRDLGPTVDMLSVFVESASYDVDGPGPFAAEPWGVGNDNLAFDGEGNLWVLQDGSRNHIWVVGSSHTAATPNVKLFATTPAGSEPTGITFTPDYKFMFISFQHPSTFNTVAQTDAAGTSVVFNTHTTVVVARTEDLGPLAILPVKISEFSAKNINKEVLLNWKVSQAQNHSFFVVERSADAVKFEEIFRNTQQLNNATSYTFNFTDRQLPASAVLYYRIKQCDIDGSCNYSIIRPVRIAGKALQINPVPAYNHLNLSYQSDEDAVISISITNNLGQTMHRETRKVMAGSNTIRLNIQALPKGNYTISIYKGRLKLQEGFIKL